MVDEPRGGGEILSRTYLVKKLISHGLSSSLVLPRRLSDHGRNARTRVVTRDVGEILTWQLKLDQILFLLRVGDSLSLSLSLSLSSFRRVILLLSIGRQIGAPPTAMIPFGTSGARLSRVYCTTVVRRYSCAVTSLESVESLHLRDQIWSRYKVEELWDLREDLHDMQFDTFLNYLIRINMS